MSCEKRCWVRGERDPSNPPRPQVDLLTGKDLAFKVLLTLLNVTRDTPLGHVWGPVFFDFVLLGVKVQEAQENTF